MHTVWSARRAPSDSRSASEWASTASMPSSWHARMIRTAISPRLATSMRRIFIRRSRHHHTAVDVQYLAGDVGRLVGGEEGDHARYVMRGARPGQRNEPHELLPRLCRHPRPDLRLYEARRDPVGRDSPRSYLARDRPGEANQP